MSSRQRSWDWRGTASGGTSQEAGASLSVSGAGCPLASTEANSNPQNNPGMGFLVGLQQCRLTSEATQGLPDGGIQGGGRVDGDASGTDTGFPAVKPVTGQRLLRGLHLWSLQIWGEEKQITLQPSAPLENVRPHSRKRWALESHGPGFVTYWLWGLKQVTSLSLSLLIW